MVGQTRLVLEDILNEKQIHHILKQALGERAPHDLERSEIRSATDGIAGFLGDHKKAVLQVNVEGELKKVHLFLKRLPVCNKPKAEFINEHHYFRREQLMYKVLEEICENGPHSWCVTAYIYTDSLLVMRDLTIDGYSPRHYLYTLDAEHVFLTTTSIARFHAAYVNYETNKTVDPKHPYTISAEYGHILGEPTFCDSPWLKACSKLSVNLLQNFSTKSYSKMFDLESKLHEQYLKACDSLREYTNTVNVLNHKDLWVNNIMFKYENGVPTNVVLVDFQCLRYGPPAFDLTMFLYLTTDRKFREEREKDVFDCYYSEFIQNLSCGSKKKLGVLGYDKEDFLKWCEVSRAFGIFMAVGIFPFILMDPMTAQKTFDDPETYEKYIHEDRSAPVLVHAHKCKIYQERNVEVTEEFVERYILKQLKK